MQLRLRFLKGRLHFLQVFALGIELGAIHGQTALSDLDLRFDRSQRFLTLPDRLCSDSKINLKLTKPRFLGRDFLLLGGDSPFASDDRTLALRQHGFPLSRLFEGIGSGCPLGLKAFNLRIQTSAALG